MNLIATFKAPLAYAAQFSRSTVVPGRAIEAPPPVGTSDEVGAVA
jgi:hypothetical protein